VRIEATEPVPVQVDGEPAGMTPVDIDLLPCRIPFIVPAESDI
jgi:diacylglycerol kinase family enzyme